MANQTATQRINSLTFGQLLVKQALFIAIILVGCLGCSLPQEEALKLDHSQLEEVEELTEALANHLLEFSVAARQKDRESIAAFFAASLSSPPFPSTPQDEKPTVKWLSEHGWQLESVNREPTARMDYLESFYAFLDHFQSIEDGHMSLTICPSRAENVSIKVASMTRFSRTLMPSIAVACVMDAIFSLGA